MAIDQATLIQAVYDTIFSAFTQSPVPGLPPASQGSNIFLTLEWPGQQLDVSQYQNPWSPQNPQGSQMAIENFSTLVNPVASLSAIYVDSGITVEEMYQFILMGTAAATTSNQPLQTRQLMSSMPDRMISSEVQASQEEKTTVNLSIFSQEQLQDQALQDAYDNVVANFNATRFQYDLSNPDQKQQWEKLAPELEATVQAAWKQLQQANFRQKSAHSQPLNAEKLQASTPNNDALEPNPVTLAFANARSTFERSKLASLANPGLTYHPAYASPANWYDQAASQSWPKITISSKQLQTKTDSPFVKTGGIEQAKAGIWKLAPAVVDILKKQPTINPDIIKKPIVIDNSIQQIRLSDAQQHNLDLASHQQQIKSVQPSIDQFLNVNVSKINPEVLKVNPTVIKINPELLKEQLKNNTLDQETSDLEISFRFCRVAITRPWIMNSLLKMGGWYIPGQAAGWLSTGTLQDNSGAFPMMATALIAVRDLEIRATWGKQDREIATLCSSTSQPIGFGPFALSGKYGKSGSSYSSRFDGVTISAPGIQILGWINQITPYAPPRV